MNNQNEENFPLTQSVEEQSCATLIPLMETEDAAFLTQTDECWQENIDWMLENQLYFILLLMSDTSNLKINYIRLSFVLQGVCVYFQYLLLR